MSDVNGNGERDQRRDGRLELLSAIVLGIAALLTALAAWQAGERDGQALENYSDANRQLNDANAFYAQGNQTAATDQGLFVQYAVAATEGNTDVADYLRTSLMRPELREAVDWWENDEDAVTPFDEDEDNPYAIADWAEANALEEQSALTFDEGLAADEQGGVFEITNIFFAGSLFFAGIGSVFRRYDIRLYVIGVAVLALLTGIVGLVMAFRG